MTTRRDADRLVGDAFTAAGILTTGTIRAIVIDAVLDHADREEAIDAALEYLGGDLERRDVTKLVDLAREALTATQE